MLALTKFLDAANVSLDTASYKVHLATGNPLHAFFQGRFKEWQERQTQRNFTRNHIVSLIEVRRDTWLFVGVYKVLGCKKVSDKHIAYETELLPGQDDLIGRVVVSHQRSGRPSYIYGKPDGAGFTVTEVLPKRMSVGEFPGHNKVRVTHEELRLITAQEVPSWYGALSNVCGIYLITDTANGKLYVGSATGGTGIWQRWCSYVSNGHGGNRDLKLVLKENGSGHKLNFQYSILEIADTHSTEKQIRKRETFWKDVLCSKVHGYNGN